MTQQIETPYDAIIDALEVIRDSFPEGLRAECGVPVTSAAPLEHLWYWKTIQAVYRQGVEESIKKLGGRSKSP